MNQYQEELIWRYMEGKCTRDEITKIKQLSLTDNDFKLSLLQIQSIHQVLTQPTLHSVPETLESNVLSLISKNENRTIHGMSRTPLLVFFSTLVVLIVCYILSASPSAPSMLSEVANYLPQSVLEFRFNFPIITIHELYLVVFVVVLPALYLIDHLVQKRVNTFLLI